MGGHQDDHPYHTMEGNKKQEHIKRQKQRDSGWNLVGAQNVCLRCNQVESWDMRRGYRYPKYKEPKGL